MVGAGFGLCGLLELERGLVSQRRVSADAVVRGFDVLKQAQVSLLPGLVSFVMHESFFNVAKKLSIGALSQQFPFRLMEHVTRCFFKGVW